MFFDDSRKAITTMMAKRSEKGGPHTMAPTGMKPEETKTEDGQMDGLHAAAQDIIAAHGEKSAHRLMEAMSNFINIHSMQKHNAESPDHD